ncbi:DDE_3 domain-containing protein [Trichonephila clavipes]|nr:DDE_3 domain-containing protein [Trichonephila clavipes]
MSPDYIFMDDNSRPHRTHIVDEFFEEDIRRMDLPLRSPDLNPIEHAWDGLGRVISHRSLPPRIPLELKVGYFEEWALLPQTFIDTLISNIAAHCEVRIVVHGGHIHFKQNFSEALSLIHDFTLFDMPSVLIRN